MLSPRCFQEHPDLNIYIYIYNLNFFYLFTLKKKKKKKKEHPQAKSGTSSKFLCQTNFELKSNIYIYIVTKKLKKIKIKKIKNKKNCNRASPKKMPNINPKQNQPQPDF